MLKGYRALSKLRDGKPWSDIISDDESEDESDGKDDVDIVTDIRDGTTWRNYSGYVEG